MGVPGLFPFMLNNLSFNKAFNRFSKDSKKSYKLDYVYLDANGLLHSAAQEVYNYGENKQLQSPYENLSSQEKRQKIFEIFFQNIETIISIIIPKKLLYIAIDGPAPRAKQAQQRQRRFISAKTSTTKLDDIPKPEFSSVEITPGTEFMHELSKFMYWKIREFLSRQIELSPVWKNIDIIYSPPTVPGEGEHKCFAKGTQVLKWNGSTIAIEQLKVGDNVVGEYGDIQTVLSTVTGFSEMYKITQHNGDSYTVNKDHLLSFKIADHKRLYWDKSEKAWIVGWLNRDTLKYQRKQFSISKYKDEKLAKTNAQSFIDEFDDDDVLDISVDKYILLPKNTINKLYGYKCKLIDWPSQDAYVDPYLLGTWLGDGCKNGYEIASVDEEIIDYWRNWAKDNGGILKKCSVDKKHCGYRIVNKNGIKATCNPLAEQLRKYDLIDNKHIPKEYIANDENTRLELLAGLIDTDGNLTHNGHMIRFSQGSPNFKLFDDVVILARSLGFRCTVRDAESSYVYNGEKKYGKVKLLSISGDIQRIPTLIPRKKCKSPLNLGDDIDKMRTKILKVEKVEDSNYYGINITGNKRFLLKDCTVVHNCMDYIRSLSQYERDTATHCMFGPDGDLLILMLSAHVKKMYLFREDINNKYMVDLIDARFIKFGLVNELNFFSTVQTKQRSEDDVSNDFILLSYFVGNDFLPIIKMFYNLKDGINKMFDVYNKLKTNNGWENAILTKNGKIQLKGLRYFVTLLSGDEEKYIANQAVLSSKVDEKFIDNTLLEYSFLITDNNILGTQHISKINMPEYRISYYTKAGISSDYLEAGVKQMCKDYLQNLGWVFTYYTERLPSWNDAYTWHYAPLMNDLSKYINSITQQQLDELLEFKELGNPALPFEQLLSVLPPTLSTLLPEHYRSLMTSEDSELVKIGYYPQTFNIDYEGKFKEHQGIAILPFIQFKIVSESYKLKAESDEYKYHRNEFSKNMYLRWTDDFLVDYESDYGKINNCKIKTQLF